MFVMKNLDIEKRLAVSDKKQSYKVPEGYFEAFQDKMMAMARASAAEKQMQRTPTLWVRLRPVVAMAASFVLLAVLGTLLLKTVTPVQTAYEEDEYYAYYCEIIPRSDADALYFAQAEEGELTEDEIVAYLSDSDINMEEYYTIIDEVQQN